MASSLLNSQNVILTTAMAVSGAFIFLSLTRIRFLKTAHQNSPSSSRPCLSSDDRSGEKEKKKKKVKFADDVKDHIQKREFNSNSSSFNEKKEKKIESFEIGKIPEFGEMPANRAALYYGILRDRVHRLERS